MWIQPAREFIIIAACACAYAMCVRCSTIIDIKMMQLTEADFTQLSQITHYLSFKPHKSLDSVYLQSTRSVFVNINMSFN